MNEYVIEPEIASPAPRNASLPVRVNLIFFATLLFLSLLTCVGSVVSLQALKSSWPVLTGQRVTAQVTQVLTMPSEVEGMPDRQIGLRYSYSPPSQKLQTGYAPLEVSDARDAMCAAVPRKRSQDSLPTRVFHVGDSFPLRVAAWRGQYLTYPIVFAWQAAPNGSRVFLSTCGVLFLSGAGIIWLSTLLLRRLAFWRRHRLELLTQGIATIGTVLQKELKANEPNATPRHYLRYSYSTGAQPREREERISATLWERLNVGQSVSVLYIPTRPDDASLYKNIGI